MDNLKAAPVTGLQRKRQVKKALLPSSKTYVGSMMRPMMSGLPDISKEADASPHVREKADEKGTISGKGARVRSIVSSAERKCEYHMQSKKTNSQRT